MPLNETFAFHDNVFRVENSNLYKDISEYGKIQPRRLMITVNARTHMRRRRTSLDYKITAKNYLTYDDRNVDASFGRRCHGHRNGRNRTTHQGKLFLQLFELCLCVPMFSFLGGGQTKICSIFCSVVRKWMRCCPMRKTYQSNMIMIATSRFVDVILVSFFLFCRTVQHKFLL